VTPPQTLIRLGGFLEGTWYGNQHWKLEINGSAIRSITPPEYAAALRLRDELGLTGTKYGCGARHVRRVHGFNCGDGAAVLPDSGERRGYEPITTILSLEKNGALHPVQQAFLDAGAFPMRRTALRA